MKHRFPRLPTLILAGLFAAGSSHATEPTASGDFDKVVKPFLEEHCIRCHGEKKQKGELRLDTMPRDFASGGTAMHWADVMDRISSGRCRRKKRSNRKSRKSPESWNGWRAG